MGKKKTSDQFKQELYSIMPNIELVGEFINVNTKTQFKCLTHNRLFEAYPINMLHGHTGCEDCSREKYVKSRAKSQEKFIEDVTHVNPNVEVIGQYVNASTKVLVRCKIDNYEWNADPRKILRGTGCAVCANRVVMSGVNDVATTHPEYLKYFKNHEDATTHTAGSEATCWFVCPVCGYEKQMQINDLIRFGLACNKCYEQKHGRARVPRGYWNQETMLEYLTENYPGYSLLDMRTIQNDSGPALQALIWCGHEDHQPYWAYWTNIISGYQCLRCSHERMHKTKWNADNVNEFFKENGFTIVNKDDFVSADTPIAFYDDDKYIYRSNVGNMQKYASGERKSFSKYVGNPYAIYNIQHFCDLHRPEYCIVSSEYRGYDAKHTFRYNGEFPNGIVFDREFEMSIDLFVGRFCSHPSLSMSNGECLAVEYLNKHNIQFISQKRFDDCRDVYTLPFDFYLPHYNLVIEIMGEQHEHPVEAFGGEESFYALIRHDQMKRDYLKQNHIHCLDIWYYEFDQMESMIVDKIQQILTT